MSKVPVLGAVLLAGSAVVCPACVNSAPSQEAGDEQVAAGAVASLDVRGMTCGACATTARITFERIEGIHAADVSAESGSATVRYDRALTGPAQFIPEFERVTGYRARVVDDGSARDLTDASTATGSAPATPASTK